MVCVFTPHGTSDIESVIIDKGTTLDYRVANLIKKHGIKVVEV
jgi:hypothetical protein